MPTILQASVRLDEQTFRPKHIARQGLFETAMERRRLPCRSEYVKTNQPPGLSTPQHSGYSRQQSTTLHARVCQDELNSRLKHFARQRLFETVIQKLRLPCLLDYIKTKQPPGQNTSQDRGYSRQPCKNFDYPAALSTSRPPLALPDRPEMLTLVKTQIVVTDIVRERARFVFKVERNSDMGGSFLGPSFDNCASVPRKRRRPWGTQGRP
jgi:hypothetical protein